MRRHLWLILVLVVPLLTGCRTDILHGLSEQESNEVIAVLQEQGIYNATKELDNAETNTYRVSVAQSEAVKVWSILQEYRLPSNPGRRIQDVFGKSKLVVAPIEEKALFLEASQGELSHTLEAVTGVITARVHIVVPEPDIMGQVQGEAKASVMIEYRPDTAGQAPLKVEEIQRIVANATSGLKPDAVIVVMKPIQMMKMVQSTSFSSFGPFTVAQTSVTTFKVTAALVFVFILLLAFMLFWQGRLLGQLRYELSNMERSSRASPRK